MRRRIFSQDSIALQIGEELVVWNHRFVAAFGNYGQVVQIFEELFVIADWKNDGCALAVVIREVLEWLAHAGTLRRSD